MPLAALPSYPTDSGSARWSIGNPQLREQPTEAHTLQRAKYRLGTTRIRCYRW
jgi:hypothetical protein